MCIETPLKKVFGNDFPAVKREILDPFDEAKKVKGS